MSTPAQIGKNEYKAAIVKCRNANREARGQLKRIISETSSNLIRALVGQVLLALSENDEAVDRLDEIGRNAKSFDGSNRAPCPDTSHVSLLKPDAASEIHQARNHKFSLKKEGSHAREVS